MKATENLNQQKDEAEPESKAILLEKVGDDETKSKCNPFDTSLEFCPSFNYQLQYCVE